MEKPDSERVEIWLRLYYDACIKVDKYRNAKWKLVGGTVAVYFSVLGMAVNRTLILPPLMLCIAVIIFCLLGCVLFGYLHRKLKRSQGLAARIKGVLLLFEEDAYLSDDVLGDIPCTYEDEIKYLLHPSGGGATGHFSGEKTGKGLIVIFSLISILFTVFVTVVITRNIRLDLLKNMPTMPLMMQRSVR